MRHFASRCALYAAAANAEAATAAEALMCYAVLYHTAFTAVLILQWHPLADLGFLSEH
jgi:hypothetical protein